MPGAVNVVVGDERGVGSRIGSYANTDMASANDVPGHADIAQTRTRADKYAVGRCAFHNITVY